MDGEQIIGMIVMCAASFGCGGLFHAIGIGQESERDQ